MKKETKKYLDERRVMEEMECWLFQEHMKKCRDCQRIIIILLLNKL